MASILVEDVSLNYPIYDAGGRSLKSAIIQTVGAKMATNSGRVEVEALRDISLNLKDGDRLGIVGHNGAGKTTLLRVLGGAYEPPKGRVLIDGTVSSLTDITMGMDMDATGRENVRLRCVFLGMSYSEAARHSDEIAEFSELGSFLDLPIRTYSTGMLVRLAFAASTASRPQILIMDEMIGAGDAAFAEKAKARVNEYVENASILVLASHNDGILRTFCNQAILLDQGRITFAGSVDEVLERYHAEKGRS
ncbi:ABC transporter ATP-binding protein [Shinella sedimenti]|uniref:ABC transporter ATP-binding protein n=1 Tax=Shinella sedimenti TaxID=2919913 RepID=A0ABT0CS13_9HYPH|nr:ABC transporter ATP-binding protein [Shinella sedimenti]MCJ8151398.1 ABC transporter ATP-binding protein [Shinella sedimenti]